MKAAAASPRETVGCHIDSMTIIPIRLVGIKAGKGMV